MSDNLIFKLNLERLREVLQQAGYRVETATDPVANTAYLRSATSGLAFDVRPGNRAGDDAESFVDVAFTAVLQVQGELPLDIVNRWNATRRFGRLQLSQPFLVFSMDFAVAGGVTPDHLRAQIEIWDRLVQELITHLREELGKLSAISAAKESAARPPKQDRAAEADAPTTIQ